MIDAHRPGPSALHLVRSVLAAALLALSLLIVGPAGAQGGGKPAEAGAEPFNAGTAAYRAKDFVAARGHYQRACDAGHTRGCAVLAILLRDGQGGPADAVGAVAEFRKACDAKNAQSCRHLGFMLRVGARGVAADHAGARAAYRQGCDGGDGLACGGLGGLLTGAEARDAYRKACEQNFPTSCEVYGAMLRDGNGGPQDAAGAQAAFTKACSLGQQSACRVPTRVQSPSPPPAPVVAVRDARIAEHRRLYGATDSRVAASPALYAAFERIRTSDRSARWTAAKVDALARHIVEDGRIDAAERDLIIELTYPFIRVFNVYPESQTDPFSGVTITAITTTDNALRAPLLALLDLPDLSALSWAAADRPASLRKLFDAGLGSGAAHRTAHARTALASEVARLAAASTVQNGYGPLRAFISEAMGIVNSYEGANNAAVRGLVYDAIVQGVDGAPVTMPRFLYNWIRPGGYAGPERPQAP